MPIEISEFKDLGRVAYITGNVKEALDAWQALESVVEIANSVQQLKAEIAALANELESYACDHSVTDCVYNIVEKMRQLSAV